MKTLQPAALTETTMQRLVAVVGEKYALREPDEIEPYTTEARGRYHTTSPLVLRPGSTQEVAAILKIASQTGTPIVPQGGNTGLVGAGIPSVAGSGCEVMLSLGRLNKIINVDPDNNTMTVEAGAVLQNIQNAASDADRLFPLTLGAQGSCQIGGNISSNAGGVGVLSYGNTRDLVMGLEVVLPSGEIWNGLSRLRKDNTGYDLKNLFIGAEGTLGVVTKAVVKLFPKPRGRDVAYAALRSPDDALTLLNLAKAQLGAGLTAFELISHNAMECTVSYSASPQSRPVQGRHPWYVLVEVSSGRSAEDARGMMERVLGDALEKDIVVDATLAESLAQQNNFWLMRENMSWAQRDLGASVKHDISVPVGKIPEFIRLADPTVLKIVPDARVVNFGHMGDGNLHYNISQPDGWKKEDFFKHETAVHDAVFAIVEALDGSISAEHGIGQMKRDRLPDFKDATALAMMRQIKASFDPEGIMNPGKVV